MKKLILIFVFFLVLSCYAQFRRMDVNRDGVITKEEFKGSPVFFNFLDRNKDGKITEDEIKKVKDERQRFKSKNVEIIKDVVYGEVDGKKLLLDIVKPKEKIETPMPVVVFIHGGGWKGGDKRGGVRRLIPFAEDGYFCASINYRLTPEAKFPAQIKDCKCAIRFLKANSKKYKIDLEKIGVWGPSAGGHLSALVGTTGDIEKFNKSGGWNGFSSKVAAVCDWYGPSDLLSVKNVSNPSIVSLLGGKINEKIKLAKEASPVSYVSEDDPPFLIMHGEKDKIVSFSQSEILFKKLKEKGVKATLIKLKNAGHGTGFGSRELEYVKAFFDYCLKGEKKNWKNLKGDKSFIEIE